MLNDNKIIIIQGYTFSILDDGADCVSIFDTVWEEFIKLYEEEEGDYDEINGVYRWSFFIHEIDKNWERALELKERIENLKGEYWNKYEIEDDSFSITYKNFKFCYPELIEKFESSFHLA